MCTLQPHLPWRFPQYQLILPNSNFSFAYNSNFSFAYGVQPPVPLGFAHNGPSLEVGFVRLIIATGPALCVALNGVGLLTSKPHAAASCGRSNQKPMWKACVAASLTSGSKPKMRSMST